MLTGNIHNNPVPRFVFINNKKKKGGENMKKYKDFLVDADLNIYNQFIGNRFRPFKGSDGYMAVKLNMKEHKTCERVHIIYANCFIPNPNGYKYINHIDSDKTNNSLNNLEWCTNSYNVQHSYNNGGDTNPIQVCVYKNGELIGKYPSLRKCCSELHLDRHKVSRALKGELRKDYFEGYIFEYKYK